MMYQIDQTQVSSDVEMLKKRVRLAKGEKQRLFWMGALAYSESRFSPIAEKYSYPITPLEAALEKRMALSIREAREDGCNR